MINTQPKKVFTMEDNVRTIAFALKDISKQLEKLNEVILAVSHNSPQKFDDENLPSF